MKRASKMKGQGAIGAPSMAAERADVASDASQGMQGRYGNAFLQERLAERGPSAPPGAVAHVGGKASIPTGNFGPEPTVQDGSEEQGKVLRAAVTEARRMAAVGLGVLRAGASSERDRSLLESHFHTTDPKRLETAKQVLTSTLTGLNTELPLEVESTSWTPRGPANGWVIGGPFAGLSNIHLTPKFFQQSAPDQGATILHEGTHKFAATTDHAYGGDGPYPNLTAEQALENADSYALFCQQHLGDRMKVEEEEQERRAEEAAETHGEEVWAAWEAGAVAYGRDGFTTSAGVELPIGMVKRVIFERFGERYPERYADIVHHLREVSDVYGAVRCRDGYVAPQELVWAVADEEAI